MKFKRKLLRFENYEKGGVCEVRGHLPKIQNGFIWNTFPSENFPKNLKALREKVQEELAFIKIKILRV